MFDIWSIKSNKHVGLARVTVWLHLNANVPNRYAIERQSNTRREPTFEFEFYSGVPVGDW